MPYTTSRRSPMLSPRFLTVLAIALVVALGGKALVSRLTTHPTASAAASPALGDTSVALAAAAGCTPTAVGSGNYVVGIQAGHLEAADLPDEQSALRWDLGGSAGGYNEVDITTDIAQRVVTLLKNKGVSAEVLPATVPADYCANVFLALHSDGNDDTTVSGYKLAPSTWDTDGKAQILSDDISRDYLSATSMDLNPTITDDMTQYYAFNFGHYQHSVDPATPSAILELGFLTNAQDRSLMVNHSQLLAQGIANGVMDYLTGK